MRHKWEAKWDDAEDACIDFCEHCKLKRRVRIYYTKGTMIKAAKNTEYLIDDTWQIQAPPPDCEPKKQKI